MVYRLLALLVTAALVGCASTPTALPQTSRVAVVSLLGSELKLRQVGITVFGNSSKSVDVTTWNVDTHVEESATAALETAGRSAARAAPESAREIGKWSYTPFTSTYSFAGGAAGLRKVALQAHADYLILVTEMPFNFTDPFFRTNQSITGFGVYQRRGSGGIIYADLGILLVDGRSGDVLDRRRGVASAVRPESVSLDIENTQPEVSALGQAPADFFAVIDEAVKKGFGYLGLVPPK